MVLWLQRLEVNEVVRKLEESRTFTTREIQPRKVRFTAAAGGCDR